MATYIGGGARTTLTRQLYDPTPATTYMLRGFQSTVRRPSRGQVWPRLLRRQLISTVYLALVKGRNRNPQKWPRGN